jgi:hypothetical protein
MDEIRGMFSVIKDERHQGYVKHKLVDMLIMIMGGVMCGITELADMMVYLKSKMTFYREQYGIEKYPSKPTLSRILNMVDGDAVGTVIAEIMRRKAGNLSDIIATDGKAIKSTGQKDQAHSFLQILTAYVTGSGVTLGQEAIDREDKTNEIPVFQSMLGYLLQMRSTIQISKHLRQSKKTEDGSKNVFAALQIKSNGLPIYLFGRD